MVLPVREVKLAIWNTKFVQFDALSLHNFWLGVSFV